MAVLIQLFLIACVTILRLPLLLAESSCYHQDASLWSDGIVCNNTASSSLCCQQGSACLSNGLCFLKYDASINIGGCTDRTWTSPNCFQGCPKSYASATLYRCDDNDWCCSDGGNTTSCCNDDGVNLFRLPSQASIYNGTAFASGVTLDAVSSAKSSSPSSSKASPTPASAASTIASAPSAAATTSDCDAAKRDVGLGAGLGTGLPLLALLAAVTILFFRQKKIIRDLRGMQKPINGPTNEAWATMRHNDQKQHTPPPRSELPVDSNSGKAELSASRDNTAIPS
ncbi:hypothetical protein ACLMJK_001088 [Lecanora helva]